MRGFYVTVTAVTLGLWIAMSFVVPSVVMDEVFHAGQARVYALSSNWLRAPYHPALTTPPGLYWTSPSVLFGAFLLPALRSTNALYGLGTGALLHSLVAVNRRTSNAKHQPKTSQEAFTLWLFPLSFFFHFLYYTDSGSTFWMLLGLLQTRRGAYTLAALSCVLGMTFRQTNVIWTAYFCGLGVIQVLQGTPGGPNVKKTRSKMAFRDIPVHSFSQASHQLYAFIQAIILNISSLILKLWGFLIALSSFAVFVWHNGGIVLGDKSNHVSAFHLPQLYYFSAFTAILTLSHLEPLKCATELVTKGVSYGIYLAFA